MKVRWTLRDLVDFEILSAREDPGAVDEASLREKVKGLEGAVARRSGMKFWLEQVRDEGGPGDVWSGARFVTGAGFGLLMLMAGVGVMTGLLDRERMAFHVPIVLGVGVGLPLLVLLLGGVTWMLRRKFSNGLGFVQGFLGKIVGKLGGGAHAKILGQLRLEGGTGWRALCWNLFRMTQAGAVMFSVGLMAGLLGCIWFLEVGFYWESTTPVWMAERIHEVCRILSAPWAWLFPGQTITAEGISRTRWVEGGLRAGRMQSAATWYPFLFAAIFAWGVVPRMVLWLVAALRERSALEALDFQSKRHRKLWRKIMGTKRVDLSEEPLDGVLVLDVGGTGMKVEDLRGFLLRRLRVNPGEWFEVGVWDEKGEEAAAISIRNAPAGVVFLAEGWALSPPRMKALLSQVRKLSGEETRVFFLVANAGREGEPREVENEEKEVWCDFVDELADASAEIYFYEEEER